MHIIAAKAVCFKENMSKQRKTLIGQVVKNADALASYLSGDGFDLVSGGTDNHLMLVDLRSKDLTGKEAEEALNGSGITVNKNTIPFDPQKPFITSGLRIGTPCVTIRGMREAEMNEISDESVRNQIRGEVSELTSRYPVYI
jgi:glycine hydroxymethyltransferase